MKSFVKFYYVVALICMSSSDGCCSRRHQTRHANIEIRRKIAQPLIQAFVPRGLRVSIPDFDGMELFAFHGNINSPMQNLEAGMMSKDIISSSNGRWIFEDKNVQLRAGDVINYWIFAQVSGTGHRVDSLSSIIRELSSYEDISEAALAHEAPLYASGPSATAPPCRPIETTQQPKPTACPVCTCEQYKPNTITNKAPSADEVNNDVEKLQKEINSLKSILSEITNDVGIGTKLMLIGRQPPLGNPTEAIRNLIIDKLELFDLDEKITAATRTETGISFEVSTPLDKKRILIRAKAKLQSANYKIIDPDDPEQQASGQWLLDEREEHTRQEGILEVVTNNVLSVSTTTAPPWKRITTVHQLPPIRCPLCDCKKDQPSPKILQYATSTTQSNHMNDKNEKLQKEIDTLKSILTEVANELTIGTALLLVGSQPPLGNPTEAIRNLIVDKLELFDMDEKITTATRTKSGIAFEIATPLDKKRILLRAKGKLENTRYQIIDPEEAQQRASGQWMQDQR